MKFLIDLKNYKAKKKLYKSIYSTVEHYNYLFNIDMQKQQTIGSDAYFRGLSTLKITGFEGDIKIIFGSSREAYSEAALFYLLDLKKYSEQNNVFLFNNELLEYLIKFAAINIHRIEHYIDLYLIEQVNIFEQNKKDMSKSLLEFCTEDSRFDKYKEEYQTELIKYNELVIFFKKYYTNDYLEDNLNLRNFEDMFTKIKFNLDKKEVEIHNPLEEKKEIKNSSSKNQQKEDSSSYTYESSDTANRDSSNQLLLNTIIFSAV